jgi:hypothetical protein
MKKMFLFALISISAILLISACKKREQPYPPTKKLPADVAVEWMRLHMRLTMSTPGFNSIVAGRSLAYAGLTLYESVVPGIRNGRSLSTQLTDGHILASMLPEPDKHSLYIPAATNAAMASITKFLFANTSAANKNTIDSLETSFKEKFASEAKQYELQSSESFGKKLGQAIFNWSKTDGGHEGYLRVTDPTYTPPTGSGIWIPTAPAFGSPIHPRWGSNRSFIPGITSNAQAPVPLQYSEDKNSIYYKQAEELYNISLSLSREDSITARFWADLPTNYNVPAHATGILTQLIVSNKFKLDEAAIAYVKHSLAVSDAIICVFKAKYANNTIRPISFIRNILNHPQWNTVVPTPPHPEFPAAHGVLSGASAAVMEVLFADNGFTDHTYDHLYGPRSFKSFDEYAKEAGYSRVLGGIHYNTSVVAGLAFGRKVGQAVNALDFEKGMQVK